MEALIIIDMQPDFLPGGSLAVNGGDTIIPVINELAKKFALVVATQDWHPPAHGSFASAHPGKKPFEHTILNGLEQVLWPDHCVQGTPGAEIAVQLHTQPIEAIFRKGTDPGIDSYSGFYDNGHRKTTGLAGYLKARGVTHVYVCGLAADYCVYFTAKDAIQEGFATSIIADATQPISLEGWEKAQQDIIAIGGKIITSDIILATKH